MNRVSGAYDQEGNRVSTSRDLLGRVRSITANNNRRLTTTGAQKRWPLKAHHPAKDTKLRHRPSQRTDYDANGNVTKLTQIGADASTRDGYRFYDELNRPVREVGPLTSVPGAISTPPANLLPMLQPKRCHRSWAGPSTDTVSSVCNFADGTLKRQVAASYDDLGRRLTQTDALNRTWTNSYDFHGNLISSRTPNQIAANQSSNYTYDGPACSPPAPRPTPKPSATPATS